MAPTSSGLADALVVVAEAFLAGKVAGADDAEVYQVVVHVGTGAITPAGPADRQPTPPAPPSLRPFPRKRRRRRRPPPAVPGDPADPARCHVEDGPAISVSTAQLTGCSAGWSWMLHDSAGKVLDLGRRRRRPQRGAAPRGPRTGPLPVPVPGL